MAGNTRGAVATTTTASPTEVPRTFFDALNEKDLDATMALIANATDDIEAGPSSTAWETRVGCSDHVKLGPGRAQTGLVPRR